jgi:hypothetical protein
MSSVHHNHPKVTVDLKTARQYLAALEAIAHMGRSSEDPREVFSALKTFAEPGDFLKRFTGVQV